MNPSSNGYVQSFSARPLPDDLFPNLVIRSCISEASESLNGPRYAAQDRKTFDVYEVRYTPFEPHLLHEECSDTQMDPWSRQQGRIQKLLQAGERHFPFVSLPHSIFVHDEGKRRHGIASVEDFSGLSLGDIVRSGWTLIEESLLNDVLEAVEAFGKMCPLLPSHGNLSADCVKQLLTVREVTVEALQRPRWVVSDWLLTEVEEPCDIQTSISDMEWMLTSTFSQFRIQRDTNDAFLSPADLEGKIGRVISLIRDDLNRRFSGLTDIDGMTLARSALEEEVRRCYKGPTQEGGSAIDCMDKTRYMSVKEKIAFHQMAQRDEQQQLNRYRRRHALLPPRPNQQGETMDFAKEEEEYKPNVLDSPLRVQPSIFTAGDYVSGDSDTRQRVIDDIVHLAVMYEDRVHRERKAKEEETRLQRESLRNILARSAALSASRGRSPSAHGRSEGRNEFLSFSSPAVSMGVLKKSESVSSSQGIGANPNSRRRTLNGAGSRPLTARKTSSSSAIEKTPISATNGMSQTIVTGSTPSVPQTQAALKEVWPGNNAPKGQVATPLNKRKESSVSQPYIPLGENFAALITPLPLHAIHNLTSPSEGVNVPPQHSVRGSPRGPANSEAVPSDFPMAPQSITIGEAVPPRRNVRPQARYEAWTASRASVTANADGSGKPQTSPQLLAKTLLRSNGEKSARAVSGGLLKTPPQGVRPFVQDPPAKEVKLKEKEKNKRNGRRRLPEMEGVTRGSIRTVTESSVTVPKTAK